MTSFTKRVAGGLTILESAGLLYASLLDVATYSCPANGCAGPSFIPLYTPVFIVLALVALLIGALGLWGASFAYPGGALVSAAELLLTGYTVIVVNGYAYLSKASQDGIIGSALALVALIANVIAMMDKSSISEQANPMNLPVFG